MSETSRLADIASAEWASERVKLDSLAVPEWQNTTIYWSAWTLGDFDAAFGPGAPAAVNAKSCRIIVTKALNAQGKRLFVPLEEEQLLNTARPVLVQRLAAAILKTMPKADDQDAVAKN